MTEREASSSGLTEREVIEANFFAALERLKANQPKHPVLARRAEAGKLKINASTLAKEAGHSRTLIALEDCAYPAVRKKLGDAEARPAGPPRSAIDELREQLDNAIKERDAALFWQAEHLRGREKAENKAQRLKEQLETCTRKLAEALKEGSHLQKVKG